MQPTVRRRNQQKQQSLNKYGNFLVVFMRVLDWLIWFAGVIFIYLVIAGIQYMTAGGAEQAKKGQQGSVRHHWHCYCRFVACHRSIVSDMAGNAGT